MLMLKFLMALSLDQFDLKDDLPLGHLRERY